MTQQQHRGLSLKSWAFGIACGAVVMFMVGAGTNNPQATGRYQISSWARPSDPNSSTSPVVGAYRLDTQTGEVYSIDSSGSVSKVQFPQ